MSSCPGRSDSDSKIASRKGGGSGTATTPPTWQQTSSTSSHSTPVSLQTQYHGSVASGGSGYQQHNQIHQRQKSKSPIRNYSTSSQPRARTLSRSPIPQQKYQQRSHHLHNSSSKSPIPRHRKQSEAAADLTVLVTRTDLFDSGMNAEQQDDPYHQAASPVPPNSSNVGLKQSYEYTHAIPDIANYSWQLPTIVRKSDCNTTSVNTNTSVAICRVPPCPLPLIAENSAPPRRQLQQQDDECNGISPLLNPELTKYWNQRRRLFSRFDDGIELDDEGWFSVTPEQIADHVAHRMVELVQYNATSQLTNASDSNSVSPDLTTDCSPKITVLDAFCGCGGNAIAFAKLSHVEQVICIDVDRTKLRRAANNASIYDIPPHKIVFVECNALFVLQHCYRDGQFILDEPVQTPEAAMALMAAIPPPCTTEMYKKFQIGGIDLLPRKIDVVFLDPPWGGVDYAVFGKNGYDLERNMRIQRPVNQSNANNSLEDNPGSDLNGFFDTFQTQPRNKHERKAQFNCGLDEKKYANGAELLAAAAAATSSNRQVIYDVPRNTNRISIGQSAKTAGYHGNIKVEEHYLNGRLKTITAYFGCDWRSILIPPSKSEQGPQQQQSSQQEKVQELYETGNDVYLPSSGAKEEITDHASKVGAAQKSTATTVFLPFLPAKK